MTIDAKAAAGTIGAAVSGLGWFLLAKLVDPITTWTAEDVATANGFSTVIVVGIFAVLIPNEASAARKAARRSR